jgi:hypothetical protein
LLDLAYFYGANNDVIELLCMLRCKIGDIVCLMRSSTHTLKILLRYNALSPNISYKCRTHDINLPFYIALFYPELIYLIDPIQLIVVNGITIYEISDKTTYLSHAVEYGWVVPPYWLISCNKYEIELIIAALYTFIFFTCKIKTIMLRNF